MEYNEFVRIIRCEVNEDLGNDECYPVVGNICSCSSCSWYGFNLPDEYLCPLCNMPVSVVERNQFYPQYLAGSPLSIEYTNSDYKNMKKYEIKFPVFAEEQRRYLDLWRIRLNGIFDGLVYKNEKLSYSLVFYMEKPHPIMDVVYKNARIRLFKSIVMPADEIELMGDKKLYNLVVQAERKEAQRF